MPTGRRARWIMELQQYDFIIKHCPGKQNANADALSRIEPEISCFLLGVDYPTKKKRRLSKSSTGRMQITIETPLSEEELNEEESNEESEQEATDPVRPHDFRDIGPAPEESEDEMRDEVDAAYAYTLVDPDGR